MQCNIDARGRRLRAIGGAMTLLAGALVIILLGTSWPLWLLASVLLLAGAFQLFEAWKGWCAIRAMGVRTPW